MKYDRWQQKKYMMNLYRIDDIKILGKRECMKRKFFLLLVIFLALCGCSFTSEENAFDEFGGYTELLMEYERVFEDPTYTEDKWENIYDHIGRFANSESYGLYYCIKDLSGDGKPELILSGRYDSEYRPMIIYAYADGEYIWSCISENYDMEIYENGIVEMVSGSAGKEYHTFYQLEKNSGFAWFVEEVYDIPRNWGGKEGEGMLYYRSIHHGSEDEELTEEEYFNVLNQYEIDPIELEWHVVEGFWSKANPREQASATIDQIGIQGRTNEETRLIHKILSSDKEEFQDFLTTDWEFPHTHEAIIITAYDFTGDGRDEIIVSKFYVNNSAEISYNFVYNRNGERVLEFVGGHPLDIQIIENWGEEGIFLLYHGNHYSSHNNANIYTEIKWKEDIITEEIILMELDRREGGVEEKEEYYIFKDFTKEEEEKLWRGASGVNELTKMKEYVREEEKLEEYKQLFDKTKTTEVSMVSVILYSDSDGGFVEYE